MFESIITFWQEQGYIFCVVLSILVIAIVSLYNYFKKTKRKYNKRKTTATGGSSYFPADKGDQFCSKLELRTKFIVERIFQRSFHKIRPDWLLNNVTEKPLEIDLYNEELGLGIECQGKQHYVFTPFFQGTKEAFRNQQYRDEIKRMLCEKKGIILIEIPYNMDENAIEPYIRSEYFLKRSTDTAKAKVY